MGLAEVLGAVIHFGLNSRSVSVSSVKLFHVAMLCMFRIRHECHAHLFTVTTLSCSHRSNLSYTIASSQGESLFPHECFDYRDDYIECLHHPKESERRRAIVKQMKRREKMEKEAGQVAAVANTEAGEATTQPPS